MTDAIEEIAAGRSRWRSNDELRGSTPRDAVAAGGVAELSPGCGQAPFSARR
ncbi:MAG TPA: hypothetical protein VIK04_03935 [Solirubrobacteraceae bacterium]